MKGQLKALRGQTVTLSHADVFKRDDKVLVNVVGVLDDFRNDVFYVMINKESIVSFNVSKVSSIMTKQEGAKHPIIFLT